MKQYKDFKEYMEDNFLDEIWEHLEPYVIKHKASFEEDDFYDISFAKLDDVRVCGVTFKYLDNDWLEIRTSIDATVEVTGRTRDGIESDSASGMYNVFFKAKLDDGLQDVSVISVTDYDRATFNRERSLSQSLLEYIYEEDIEKHAEAFLKKNCHKALLQPMALPVEDIAKNMGMEIYYAPLGDGIFGKTYFGEETVTVYTSIRQEDEIEITTKPGTMLINPDVYFMRNIGTANNTIIHECVHWDKHRRAFELQRLLSGKSSHISCEIVETYNGIPEDSPALKWMEWQANQLAPRILMPAEMTKKVLSNLLQAEYEQHPRDRFAIHMENAINKLSMIFQVSNLAAKLRAIELGFDQAEGTLVYCNDRYWPPFSFMKGTLKQNETFVIDEVNLQINLMINPELGRLFSEGKIVYANCMLCMNTPKYVFINESGRLALTDYALEHVDECCYVFNRKYSASDKYSDTFYRRCFLYRDVDAGAFVEAKYDPDHKSNQKKEDREAEMKKVSDFANDLSDILGDLKGSFTKTLKAHMERLDVNEEELSGNCYLSVQTISKYLNDENANKKFENVLAVGKALNLNPVLMEDLVNKSGNMIGNDRVGLVVKFLIWNHPDDSIEEWQEKLDDAHINLQLPKSK